MHLGFVKGFREQITGVQPSKKQPLRGASWPSISRTYRRLTPFGTFKEHASASGQIGYFIILWKGRAELSWTRNIRGVNCLNQCLLPWRLNFLNQNNHTLGELRLYSGKSNRRVVVAPFYLVLWVDPLSRGPLPGIYPPEIRGRTYR